MPILFPFYIIQYYCLSVACDARAASDDSVRLVVSSMNLRPNVITMYYVYYYFFPESFVFDSQRHTLPNDHDHVATVCLLFFVFVAFHCLSYDRSKYSIHTFVFSRERLNFFSITTVTRGKQNKLTQ